MITFIITIIYFIFMTIWVVKYLNLKFDSERMEQKFKAKLIEEEKISCMHKKMIYSRDDRINDLVAEKRCLMVFKNKYERLSSQTPYIMRKNMNNGKTRFQVYMNDKLVCNTLSYEKACEKYCSLIKDRLREVREEPKRYVITHVK